MKNIFIALILMLSSSVFGSQCKQDNDLWFKIIDKLNLTSKQAYIFLDIYRGNTEDIPIGIYKSAITYQKPEDKENSEKWLFRTSLIEELLGNYNDAVSRISKAIEKNPSESKYYYTLGRMYSNHGEFGKSLQNLKKATELNPKNPYAYYELYYLYKNSPETAKAAENLEKFIKLAPEGYFKGLAMDSACKYISLEKNLKIEGCPSKDDYKKSGFTLNVKSTREDWKQNIGKTCCEYECETYITQCCEESECTDYDYYTSECVNYKCKKWVKCEKEKCKCTKECE